MLKSKGHLVYHYGHEKSVLVCDEHVTVTTDEDLARSYPGHDWRTMGHPPANMGDLIYATFYERTIPEIRKRLRPGDFLLCPWGMGHKPLADALPEAIAVESGIGNPAPYFAPYKVFESYAVMHAAQGNDAVRTMSNNLWYDVVIPNYFDPTDFAFSGQKDDYLLFLGRVGAGKGINIAVQIAEATGHQLVVAGPGRVEHGNARTSRPMSEYVTEVGVVGPEARAKLLSRAKAVICASTYLEPFCGVQVEAMMSGTPVISTDWGAFTEVNLHGITGYRCRTFEQFTWAARNIGNIRPQACREWAMNNFSLDRVAAMYDEYFASVAAIHGGLGWYQENPERSELDWLTRHYP